MPKGKPVELTVDLVLGRSHRLEVLRALTKAPDGLRHKEVQKLLVSDLDASASVASQILNELCGTRLAILKDPFYQATEKGRRAVSLKEDLQRLDSTRGLSDGGTSH